VESHGEAFEEFGIEDKRSGVEKLHGEWLIEEYWEFWWIGKNAWSLELKRYWAFEFSDLKNVNDSWVGRDSGRDQLLYVGK